MDALTITLSQPLEIAGSQALGSITIRRPSSADFYELPAPVSLTQDRKGTRVAFDPEAVVAWIERLSGVPKELVGRLSMADGRRLISAVDRLYIACRPVH